MNINRNNYEIYFLDYRENQLTPGEVADLMLFLEQNQDLKSEFNNFENISINPDENITYEPKESLKKQVVINVNDINAENYEKYFIASIENELKSNQEEDLRLFLQKNTSLVKEYELFKQSILTPDKSISFPDKSLLYKRAFITYWKPALYYATSAAAVILLFFSIYLNFDLPKNQENIIVKHEQENTFIEDSSPVGISHKDEQIILPSENNYTSETENVIAENSDNKQKLLYPKKQSRKAELGENNFKQLKKINTASIQIAGVSSRKIIVEERDYIYDVFRNSNVDDIQYADAEPATDGSKT